MANNYEIGVDPASPAGDYSVRTFCGFFLVEDAHLVGSSGRRGEKAYRFGNKIFISPAMMDLIRHAEGAELERLLRAIPLVTIADRPGSARTLRSRHSSLMTHSSSASS